MTKISSPLNTIINFFKQSLRRVILVTLFVVALIPLAFVLPNLNGDLWGPVYKDNLQKHKILATSLIDPIQLKIKSYQHALKLLDIELQSSPLENQQIIQKTINKFTHTHEDIVSVSLHLLSKNKSPIIAVNSTFNSDLEEDFTPPDYIAKEARYDKYDLNDTVSPIIKSSFSKKPIFLLKHQLVDDRLTKIGTIFAEIEPKFIQKICSNISFGHHGFCTIVDDKNNVIAHPNKAWVLQRHNLSTHKLVQKLRASNVGALEYKSTLDNAEMIGGYAKIKNLDWGIFVTRPKAEIELPLNTVKTKALLWLAIGSVLALIIAMIVTLKVTKPLNILNDKIKVLTQKRDTYSLGAAPKNSPFDILTLWETLSDLLHDFQELNTENIILKSSSKKDIRKIIGNRREQNLKKKNNIDPMTGLTNMACFQEELRKVLLVYRGDIAGLILIEIDNYKPLIEKGNKPLADYIIKHVANILNKSKRNDDMITHYENTGRFAIFISECSPKSLQGMADKLRSLIEVSPLEWKNDTIFINLSTGIVTHKVNEKTSVTALTSLVEKALEQSKNAGINKVSSLKDKEIQAS